MKVGADYLRCGLHIMEYARERVVQFIDGQEGSIVSSIFACMLPQPFGGIELRGIGRQWHNFHPTSVLAEPRPNALILMVRGVILN